MSHREVNRRTFVQQTGLVAGGAILGYAIGAEAAAPPAALPQRKLGKTGISLTTMTLGTAPSGFAKPHSPKRVADCVNAALDLGVNAIDTAPAYDVGEEGVGLGLGKRRKDVFLSTKVLADDIPTAEKILANSLKMLRTDYLDLVYFHQIGERKIEEGLKPDGVFAWLVRQKKAGKIRFVGASGHNRPGRWAPILESGECDALLTVVNFVDRYTYKIEDSVLPLARKHDVGLVAMKVFGGAKKMNYADPKGGSHLAPEHYELAIGYALGVEGVATLNIGCADVAQVRQDVALVARAKPLSAEQLAKADALGKSLAEEWGSHFGPVARGGQVIPGLC